MRGLGRGKPSEATEVPPEVIQAAMRGQDQNPGTAPFIEAESPTPQIPTPTTYGPGPDGHVQRIEQPAEQGYSAFGQPDDDFPSPIMV